MNVLCLVAQSCLTLCDPMGCTSQAPLFMGSSRQEYWSGLTGPPSGDLPNPGIKPRSPALQADTLLSATRNRFLMEKVDMQQATKIYCITQGTVVNIL